MASAAYYRAWRAAHPAYRLRQNLLRRQRRQLQGREDRRNEYAKRIRKKVPGMPGLHVGHRLFELARQAVGPRRTSLRTLYDPLYDDLLSEATLAILEGRDPEDAVRTYRSREQAYGRVTCQIFAGMEL